MPPRPVMLLIGLALSLWAPLAVAQNNLGELLDAGAKILSPDDFKEQLAQRMLIGPSPTGGTLELIYTASGMVQGSAAGPGATMTGVGMLQVSGEWTIDASGRVCTGMRMSGPGTGGSFGPVGMILPPRCQSWFKLGERYFVADSDTDRHAKVLLRNVKK